MSDAVGPICSHHCLGKFGLLSGHVCHAPGQKQLRFALTFNPFDLSPRRFVSNALIWHLYHLIEICKQIDALGPDWIEPTAPSCPIFTHKLGMAGLHCPVLVL